MTANVPSPVAQLLRKTAGRTEWRVTLADGRTYLANTYPESDLVFITNVSGRPVRGINLEPEVRAALSHAKNIAV